MSLSSYISLTKSHAIKKLFFATILTVFMLNHAAHADPLERGVQGAIGGAILGGIIDGGKGAGKGAAIGGSIGILGGAIEEERRREEYEDQIDEDRYADEYYRPAPRRPAAIRTSDLVLDIQTSLRRLGYEPGPADGVMGRQTAVAIGQYQNEYDLLVTRKPSRALLNHILKNGG
ncbi:MAG: peptidoglycan-binding domain-containing protein [Pseudomonadota bacterium]